MVVYLAKIKMRDSALIGDNDYSFNCHVQSSVSSDDAWSKAEDVADCLVGTLMPPNVTVYEISIINKDAVNGVQNRPVSMPGTRTVTGDALPGWNTIKIQARASVGSRLHTWYPRMGLTENDVNGQLLTSATQGVIGDFFNALNLTPLICDKVGSNLTNWGYTDHVQMRQLGWHRRHRVGFKRGWVPV